MKRAKFKSVDKIMWIIGDAKPFGGSLSLYVNEEQADIDRWYNNTPLIRVRVRITPAPARRKGRK